MTSKNSIVVHELRRCALNLRKGALTLEDGRIAIAVVEALATAVELGNRAALREARRFERGVATKRVGAVDVRLRPEDLWRALLATEKRTRELALMIRPKRDARGRAVLTSRKALASRLASAKERASFFVVDVTRLAPWLLRCAAAEALASIAGFLTTTRTTDPKRLVRRTLRLCGATDAEVRALDASQRQRSSRSSRTNR